MIYKRFYFIKIFKSNQIIKHTTLDYKFFKSKRSSSKSIATPNTMKKARILLLLLLCSVASSNCILHVTDNHFFFFFKLQRVDFIFFATLLISVSFIFDVSSALKVRTIIQKERKIII